MMCMFAQWARTYVPFGLNVVGETLQSTAEHGVLDEKIADAPLIHPWNGPKYHASLVRARNYARRTEQILLWAIAEDTPTSSEHRNLDEEELDAKRREWALYHEARREREDRGSVVSTALNEGDTNMSSSGSSDVGNLRDFQDQDQSLYPEAIEEEEEENAQKKGKRKKMAEKGRKKKKTQKEKGRSISGKINYKAETQSLRATAAPLHDQ